MRCRSSASVSFIPLHRDKQPREYADQAKTCGHCVVAVNNSTRPCRQRKGPFESFIPRLGKHDVPVHIPRATALESVAYTTAVEHMPPRNVAKMANVRWSRDLTSWGAKRRGSLNSSTHVDVKTTAVPN